MVFVLSLLLVALLFSGMTTQLRAQAGVMPKTLIDPASPDAPAQLSGSNQVALTTSQDGISVTIKAGDSAYPGVAIKPAGATFWDLGAYGHVEARITNTGNKAINLNLRVDNAGDYHTNPFNAEAKSIDPGQTKTLRVYFGYSYGFHPGFNLNPRAVTQVIVFTGKTSDDLAFRIDSIQGAGWAGEKIGVDPDRIAVKPPGGLLLDRSIPIQGEAQIGVNNGARSALGAHGKTLQIDFDGGKEESVTFRPADGLWNLNEQLEVRVRVKNIGQTPITPSARIESEAGPSEQIAADAPLAPGAETEIVLPFQPKEPFVPKEAGINGVGPVYYSHVTTGVTILSDTTPGAKTIQVSSIVADLPPPVALPDWLGKKPPVDGEWVQTLDEEFTGNAINPHRWNVHPAGNFWDKRMHFSKDEVIVKDGFLHLRLEKKPGHENDDPAGVVTDYAAGQPDTYGKWTQRYGYFEIKEKQPSAPCLWPGLWLMPDRGLKFDPATRGSTDDGGMELDVTESQSAWGIYRFNVGAHWGPYTGPTSHGIGGSANYVQTDKDGFIVVGLLWTPGSMVVYGNGKEIFHWENPRIASVQEYLILQNEIGGWDNEPVDDSQLPADFIVKYIRVWQRKDLATSADGPKPNKGDFDAFNETLPARIDAN